MAHPDNPVHRSTDLVAHVGQKGTLRTGVGFGRITRALQLVLNQTPLRDVPCDAQHTGIFAPPLIGARADLHPDDLAPLRPDVALKNDRPLFRTGNQNIDRERPARLDRQKQLIEMPRHDLHPRKARDALARDVERREAPALV